MGLLQQLENDIRLYWLVASGLTALGRDMCPRCTWFAPEQERTLAQLGQVSEQVRASSELSDESKEMIGQHVGYFQGMVRVLELGQERADLRASGECRTRECMAQYVTRMLEWVEAWPAARLVSCGHGCDAASYANRADPV